MTLQIAGASAQQPTIESSEPSITIDNAPWWQSGSGVVIREDMLAEDDAAITNAAIRIVGLDSQAPTMVNETGSVGIIKVKRMVLHGTVIVNRPGGRVKTVLLPHDAGKLLVVDLNYIVKQIDFFNAPMTEIEKKGSSSGANGQGPAH